MVKARKSLIALLTLFLLVTVFIIGPSTTSEAATAGWKHDSTGWWYTYSDGSYPVNKWAKIGKDWYHFNSKGYMDTGWLKSGGKWYYLGTDGVMRTGWQKSGGKWYLLGSDGIMRTGWQKSGGKWYYLGTDGIMRTGWQKSGGKWYYLGTDGVMRTGWLTIGKQKYYLSPDGDMRTGWQTISTKKYYFGTDGLMRTGWQTISGKKYYLGTDGVMRTGWQTVSGKKYYLGTDGVMRTKWQTISGKKYYFGTNGVMVTGEQTIDGECYYFDDNGVLAVVSDPDGKLERAKKLGLIDTKLYARADQAASRRDVAAILQNVHEKRYGKDSGYLKDMIEGAPGEDAVKKDATRYDFALSLYCSDLEEILDESYSGSGKNYQTWIETCTFTELPVEKGPDAAQTYIRLDGTVGGGSVWDSCSDLQDIEQGTGAPGTQHLFDYGCTPAVNYALVVYDRTDGKKILPMEIVGEKYYFRPYKTMTVRDVALAALRYFNYFEEAPEMVAYEDTRHYDTSIITDELLTKADETTKLPDCSNAELPSTWHGVLVSDMAWVTCQACGNTLDKHLYDYEIQAIKDAGYNYIGLMINFSSLQGPTPESGKLNETRLKELDRVIADCIERDIHVELRCIDVGGMTSADPHDVCMDRSTTILSDDSYIPEFAALWKTLAKRYKDIPNRYVSFNLLVEAGVSSEEQYERWFGPAVEAIREESPERCIVADIHAGGITGESMAKMGVALAAHLYEPFEFGQPYDSSKETYDEYLARNVWPYTDKNGKVWDARTAFEYQYMDTSARGVAEVAAKYGVGFMIGEWGLGSSGETRVRYSNETLKNFLTDMTDTMARYGYGWCYGDSFFQYGANAVIPWIEGEEYEQIGDYPLYQDVYVANLFREICKKYMEDPEAAKFETVSAYPGKLEQVQAAAMPYDEYDRAIWYGLLTKEYAEADPDTTYVTQRAYLDMMDRMIEKLKPERLEKWRTLTKDMSDKRMHRDDAMIILLFAARTMHMDVYNGSDNTKGINGPWNLSYEYEMPGWDKPYYVSENDMREEAFTPNDCTFSAIQYMYFRISNVTGKPLIEKRLRCGDTDGPYELDDHMTLREAVYSILRLYESDDKVAYQVECNLFEQYKNDERIKPYIEEAEARKKAIYESPTEIVKSDTYIQGKTYTGTAYYISNDGDDSNDGLTPETAWATPLRCESADLQFGDAVFFRRGDTWRGMWQGWNMATDKGVTYSAYGEGAKPKLYGSPENGAGAEKWELYYQDGDKKIWKFHRKMPETGMVVFNDETYAMRATPYWDGHEFINLDAVEDLELPYTIDETTPRFDVRYDLPDMWCFPELPYEEKAWSDNMVYCSSESSWTEGLVLLEGDFFLRCDAGNPGELYDSIEFCSLTGMGGWGYHATIDNLEVSYQSGLFTGAPDEETLGGTYVYFQNCIGRWSGTFVTDYAPLDDLNRGVQGYINCGGGFFNINGPGCHATNNYCEHGFQDTPGIETFSETKMNIEDFLIEGNVCYYCGMGCGIINYDMETNPDHTMKDVVFNDNMYMFCGFDTLSTRDWYPDRRGFNGGFTGSTLSQRFENSMAHVMSWELAHDGGLKVTNNKFILSASQLINFRGYNEKYYSVHDGNFYAQLPGTLWLTVIELNTVMGQQMYTDPEDVFGTYIHDEHATVIRFDEE